MNKRIFYLLILLFITITIFNITMYINIKNNTINTSRYLTKLEYQIKQINLLKEKYTIKKTLLKRVKNFCNVSEKENSIFIICKNLNADKFNTIQNLLFKSNVKIKSFKIEKKESVFIEAEIKK